MRFNKISNAMINPQADKSASMQEYLDSLQLDVDWPLTSALHHFPNGNAVQVELKDNLYYPMVAQGDSWAYFYPRADIMHSVYHASATRICCSTLNGAIDYLTGELLEAYNEMPVRVWP